MVYHAAASSDKQMQVVKGASHYFVGQPGLMQNTVEFMLDWLHERNFCKN